MGKLDLREFANDIRVALYMQIPREETTTFIKKKHKGRILDALDKSVRTSPVGLNAYYFQLGNEDSEKNAPQYHILEDSAVIRKRGESTKATRGSQDKVKDLSQRDYGKWTVKTIHPKGKETKKYTQEYRKKVARSRIENATRVIRVGKKTIIVNPNSKEYVNVHYHYIENAFSESILNAIAVKHGLAYNKTYISSPQIDIAQEKLFER